jgi:hypothetical protein
MDHYVSTDPYEANGGGLAVKFMDGSTVFLQGKDAERVLAWIKENGDLPAIAPG